MLSRNEAMLPNPVWVLGIYTGFAFVLTWMREIVKDMEDHIGDAAEGCVTMPIRLGLQKSGRFTQLISLAAIIPLLIASVKVQGALGLFTFEHLGVAAQQARIYSTLSADEPLFERNNGSRNWIFGRLLFSSPCIRLSSLLSLLAESNCSNRRVFPSRL